MKRQSILLALCAALVCSPVYAKTFVGVLWPMFGPTAAPGLVELVAELKMMPDAVRSSRPLCVISGLMHCSKNNHSITLSARAKNERIAFV
jgi:hypothetical protein